MCGIAGIWNFNKAIELEDLKTFTDSMEHRGPDGFGYDLLDKSHLGLGHRRLSILDLSENGKQPMTFEEYTVVYNGEIFNFDELKQELIQIGHSFKTETDTEVLLISYKEWGNEAFHKWNGMWAFAMYNSINEELLLCSDRFGIKPCYYSYEEGKRFSFASETYAFKFLEGYQKLFDKKNILIELEDPYVLEPLGHTIYSNIFRLLPGHIIKIKRGQSPKQQRWYDVNKVVKPFEGTFDEAKEKFRSLLIDSCKLRLQSDVPLATALSGGLDSSAVLGVVQHISKEKLELERTPNNLHNAYTMTFPGWEGSEEEYAKKVCNFNKINGKFVQVSKNDFANRLIGITEKSDFITSTSILSLVDLYKAMSDDGVKVSLDGHGVDEMLFGYRNMIMELYEKNSFDREVLKKTLLQMNNSADQVKLKQYFNRLDRNSKFPFNILSGIKNSLNKSLVVPDSLSNTPYQWDPKDAKSIAYHYFFTGSLIPILRIFDKASMLSNVEVRMPFMDFRLVEFSFSLPLSFLVSSDFTKLILRESLSDLLPDKIKNRKLKIGFQSPIKQWINDLIEEDFKPLENNKLYKDICHKLGNKNLTEDNKWKLYNLAILDEYAQKH